MGIAWLGLGSGVVRPHPERVVCVDVESIDGDTVSTYPYLTTIPIPWMRLFFFFFGGLCGRTGRARLSCFIPCLSLSHLHETLSSLPPPTYLPSVPPSNHFLIQGMTVLSQGVRMAWELAFPLPHRVCCWCCCQDRGASKLNIASRNAPTTRCPGGKTATGVLAFLRGLPTEFDFH